jgi:alpha,alpha-trehalase
MTLTVGTASADRAVAQARGSLPIAEYGLLADCNTAALVARDGSIDWLCFPRYDSPSVFARLLDEDAGHWSIRPAAAFTSERRYLPGTLVLETTFTTDTGSVKITDALVFADGQRGHDLGYETPHELVRSVEGLAGEVELAFELAPRTEYGLVRPLIRMEGDGGRTFGGPNRIAVRAGVPLTLEDVTMKATFTVAAGDTVGFSLRWVPTEAHEPPQPTAPADAASRLADTVEAGRARHLRRPAP